MVKSVVVIGGGVFGCATAYRLARRGIKTVLVERDEIGSHASGKNAGNLNPVLAASPQLVPFALESFRLHQELATELTGLGCADYDLQAVRRIFLAFDATELAALNNIAVLFEGREGFAVTPLEVDRLFHLEPRLSRDIVGGLLVEGNMSVHSHAFNLALARAATLSGVSILRKQVAGLSTQADRVTGVRTEDEEIACDAVVIATGPWVGQTEQWLGYTPEVVPVKGEMLRMKLSGAGLEYDFTRGMISLYRRGHDECWVGVTKDHAGLDETPTANGRENLLNAAAQLMPAVKDAILLEHAASLRPMSANGLPIVGLAPGWKNAYVANGGGIKGILLCTGISEAISDLILKGETELSITGPANQENH